MHPLNPTHSPRTFASTTGSHRIVLGDSPFEEFPDPGSTVLPLFPEDRSESPSNPMIQRFEAIGGLSEAVIAPPALQVLVEFRHHLPKAAAACARRYLSYLIPETFDRLPVNTEFWTPL